MPRAKYWVMYLLASRHRRGDLRVYFIRTLEGGIMEFDATAGAIAVEQMQNANDIPVFLVRPFDVSR